MDTQNKVVLLDKMTIFFFIIVFSLMPLKIMAQRINWSEELSITLELDKNKYYQKEQIWFTINIKNNSNVPANKFYFLNQKCNCLNISDSKGKIYTSGTSISAPPIKIGAGKDFSSTNDLLLYYGDGEGSGSPHSYLPIGDYNIFAVFHYAGFKIMSNNVNISVIMPKDNELAALKLLNKTAATYKIKFTQKRINILTNLVELYSHSVYAPKALEIIGTAYKVYLNDKEKALEKRYELIEKYPKSHHAIRALGLIDTYYENIKDRKGAEKAFQVLINKYPGTKLAKDAQRRLKRIGTRGYYDK